MSDRASGFGVPPPARSGHRVLGQVIRFGITGITATLVHFLVLTGAVEILGLSPVLANGLAFSVAVSVTYLGQSRWVFHAKAVRGTAAAGRLSRFAVSVLAGLAGNMGIMALATRGLGLDYRIGFAAGLILVPVATFVLNKFWVFGARPHDS
ncbi:MAG: GtrA family protein [Qingshengfaniella sp.]